MINRLKDFFNFGEIKKWPSKKQWRQFFRILTKKEKFIFSLILFITIISFFTLIINLYFDHTEIRPNKGGIYIEGIVGPSPRFINPIYAPLNDVDRDLVELTFSGLMKYNNEGKIIYDLAQDYKIEENGTVFLVYLKNNILWDDGEKLTADDVIFTIKTIQNTDYKSPLMINWLGVRVEKVSDSAIRFKLEKPYSSFLENLTLKIIPEHIWKNISPQNFPLTDLNLNPVGSGPYKLDEVEKDKLSGDIKSLTLISNSKYFGKKPYIPKINFIFFKSEGELIKYATEKNIEGFSITSIKNFSLLKEMGFKDYHLSLPRYFALFFNPSKSKILNDKEIRKALSYGTNKEELLNKVLDGQGRIVDSPILPDILGFNNPSKIYKFDENLANDILEKAGFLKNGLGLREKSIKKELAFQFKSNLSLGSQGEEVKELQKCLAKDTEIYPESETTGYFGQKTKEAVVRFQEKYREEILTPQQLEKGTGDVKGNTRSKLNEICFGKSEEKTPLKFTLTTVNQPELLILADLLKEQWAKIGAEIEIKTFDMSTFDQKEKFKEEIISPRNYDILLFGEVLGLIPDPFPFWHSSQKKDPGLNLALFENKDCDKLLEGARQSLDEAEREKDLDIFQNCLIEEAPAIFLYNPDYLYLVSDEIKGVNTKIIADPSQRFLEIENWYTRTSRRFAP